MKSISTQVKVNVIELFLQGFSYDEIAMQTGIGKGTVASIVDDFRNGALPVPPGMTGYVDDLRKLSVDLKKNHTSVQQAISCHKLQSRITAKGISSEKVVQWLDVVESIATPTVSNKDFIMAALELAEVTSSSGKSYKSIVHDCIEKQATGKKLNSEIKKRKKEIITLNQEHHDKVTLYTSDLKTITNAVETAQAMFEQQTKDLMYQKNLTFDEVNTVSAILNTELGKIELNQENIQQISKQISEIGSLTIQKKNLEEKKLKLEVEVQGLSEKKAILENSAKKLQMKIRSDEMVIVGQKMQRDQLDAEIKVKGPELEKLDKSIKESEDIIYQANLIMAFLITPKSLKEQYLDDLVQLLIALRQKSLGISPKKVQDENGNLICKCTVPVIDSLSIMTANIDNIREQLALNLIPLVKDKFISVLEHKIALAACKAGI